MMTKQLALIAMMTIAGISAVSADDTGFAAIHAWKAEKGGRVCMADHFHDGSGTAATRKEAEASAKSSWMSFTIFEYGTDWGSYAMAVSQTMNCSNAGQSWSCSTSARPCRKQPNVKSAKRSRSASQR
jgi:hypothetical protein